MYLMDFSITPLGKGESVSPYVARSLRIIESSGLDYRLHAMGTTVEGGLEEVLEVLKQCFEDLSEDCHRITCTAKLDYRRSHRGRLVSKVRSVEEKLSASRSAEPETPQDAPEEKES
jgi:uncharacterized protein (TIGR00106 family)